jgi:hypothetical protein
MAAVCSAWLGTAAGLLVDKGAPRECEEDVLECAPAHEDAVRLDATGVHGAHRALSVVRVDEDAVGEYFQPCSEPLEPPLDTVPLPVGEAELDDLALNVLLDECAR